jgi:1-deoxy-D-xylulose-5-phosphate synthase
VVFALDRAGVVSDDGPTHQGINDIVYLRHMPNMIVMAPRDEGEMQRMLKSALSFGHPAALRFPKGAGVGVRLEDDPPLMPLGKSELIKEGKDLLLALGSMVNPALEAAERLENEGFRVAVVNARFAKPLDEETILRLVQKESAVITVEEGVLAGGFGSAVRELLDRHNRFDVRFKSIGLPLEVYPLGKADQIRKRYGLDADGLADQVRVFLI